MTCPRHEELSAYLDDMLPAAERERLAVHFPACPLCRGRLEQLSALRLSLRELPSPMLGFDLAARLGDRLAAPPARRRRPRRFWPSWLPAGLSAAVALGSGIWLGGLLVGGSAGVPVPAITLRVFDPVPPGGLCAAPELCRLPKGLQ
jgi:anti-sigma factor RsiW